MTLLYIYLALGCVAALIVFVRELREDRDPWDWEKWGGVVLVCLFIGALWPLAFSAWLFRESPESR